MSLFHSNNDLCIEATELRWRPFKDKILNSLKNQSKEYLRRMKLLYFCRFNHTEVHYKSKHHLMSKNTKLKSKSFPKIVFFLLLCRKVQKQISDFYSYNYNFRRSGWLPCYINVFLRSKQLIELTTVESKVFRMRSFKFPNVTCLTKYRAEFT